jgi:hypothetical protein
MPLTTRGALLAAFSRLDRNGDGVCTRAELIKALRTDDGLRVLLQLPARVKENDRAAFEAVFQGMDVDDDRAVTAEEFVGFVVARGHKVPPPHRSQRSERPAQSAPAPAPLQQHEASGSVLELLEAEVQRAAQRVAELGSRASALAAEEARVEELERGGGGGDAQTALQREVAMLRSAAAAAALAQEQLRLARQERTLLQGSAQVAQAAAARTVAQADALAASMMDTRPRGSGSGASNGSVVGPEGDRVQERLAQMLADAEASHSRFEQVQVELAAQMPSLQAAEGAAVSASAELQRVGGGQRLLSCERTLFEMAREGGVRPASSAAGAEGPTPAQLRFELARKLEAHAAEVTHAGRLVCHGLGWSSRACAGAGWGAHEGPAAGSGQAAGGSGDGGRDAAAAT